MSSFGERSQDRLNTCHTDLIVLFEEVVKTFDCAVVCGFRGDVEQNALYLENKTQTKWPDSKHNKEPAMAADVVPYPVDWKDRERFTLFAGYVLGVARELKDTGIISHEVRWGGDWNMNHDLKDNKFDDLVHFELI